MLNTIIRRAAWVPVVVLMSAASVAAQPLDKRVIFNFSGPVTLPGVTLPAGSYLFRVPTPNRDIIQVLSADGTKIYGTFFAIAAHRSAVPEKPELRFMETKTTMPHAIRTWWYPADSTGFEFIYPKRQARLLAKGVGEPVLTTKAQTTTTAQTQTDELTRISSTGQETAVNVKTTPPTPADTTSTGELASPTMVIPSNPVPMKVENPETHNE
jgi:hypothetical protein